MPGAGHTFALRHILRQTPARAGGKTLNRTNEMARKPGTRTDFVLFDVLYEDGSQRSNRKVPASVLGGLDGDDVARTIIEEQDQAIAEKSGMARLPIKSVSRSGEKKK